MPKGKRKEARTSPEANKVSPAPPAVTAPPPSTQRKAASKVLIAPPGEDESGIPEELAGVWDTDIAAAFKSLRPQQQDFLMAYIQTGNAAAAYRKAYNPLAKDHLASVCGSQHLASLGIQSILAKFASQKTEALFLVLQGYREMAAATKADWVKDENGQYENAGDAPDWQARKEAFLGLRKIHGLDAADKLEHSGEISTSAVIEVHLPAKRA